MARIALSDLNDAILGALKANETLWGATGRLKAIKEYEGDAEAYLAGEAQTISNTPSALLLFNEGINEEQNTNFSFNHPVSFSILLISGNLRGGSFRKRDLLELYEEIIDTLSGKRLGLAMDPIRPEGWRVEFEGANHTAMEINFQAEFDFDISYDFPS